MKITHTILALVAAGFLGHSAFGSDNNGQLCLAVMSDPHGGYHFLYVQTGGTDQTSVALSTSSGGLVGPVTWQGTPPANYANTRFVIGTNQHGQANAAYIPTSSNFAPAGQ